MNQMMETVQKNDPPRPHCNIGRRFPPIPACIRHNRATATGTKQQIVAGSHAQTRIEVS